MGQYAFSNEARAEVIPAPGFRVAVTPELVQVPANDLDMVARFVVNLDIDPEYVKPIYLLLAGYSGGEFKIAGASIMVPEKDYALLPAGVNTCDLEIDMVDYEAGFGIPFQVGGYEDEPIPAEPVL